MLKRAKEIGFLILSYPIALYLLFEEWGWEYFAAMAQRIANMPLSRRIERKIGLLPAWAVVTIFCTAVTLLLPLKLLALLIFKKGHYVLATLYLISVKIFGTVFFAGFFELTEPVLMKLEWFSKWYPRWKNWKDTLLRRVRSSAFWRIIIKFKQKIKLKN